ncbi:hypothetical protein EYF80_026236 [Liparis tanakae]|uniref:Uncharacterized protein n=1 Tax=Liparis tanakae TaxID=230148 RepID=A0A4Z2HF90_9TELE|nr:hypothetical protein EYF80_026236 [Liparis tanakae]
MAFRAVSAPMLRSEPGTLLETVAGTMTMGTQNSSYFPRAVNNSSSDRKACKAEPRALVAAKGSRLRSEMVTWCGPRSSRVPTCPLENPSNPSLTANILCPSEMPTLTAERTAAFMPAAGAPTFSTATLKRWSGAERIDERIPPPLAAPRCGRYHRVQREPDPRGEAHGGESAAPPPHLRDL